MQIQDLLEMSADELVLMDDAALIKHFAPMFTVTRPEQVQRKVIPQAPPVLKVSAGDNNKLKELGIDISFLTRNHRKKK